MPHSPILSSTELAALALALVAGAAACSDDDGDSDCGPGEAPNAGLTLTVGGESVTYGTFSASVNNDCTIAGSNVISVSIHGSQTGGGGQAFTLCLPRPDLIEGAAVALVPSRTPPMADDRAQVIDVNAGLAAGCTVMKDVAGAPSGTVTFSGYCDAGNDPAGYAIEVSGQIPLRRTCGGNTDSVMGTLSGRVAVAKQ